jgi:hypothetical protein
VEVEHVTLTLGAEKVVLPSDDVEQIRGRLVEQPLVTQALRRVLAEALRTGSGRIVEEHRSELITAVEGIERDRPDFYSPELRLLWEVAQNPILLTDGLL